MKWINFVESAVTKIQVALLVVVVTRESKSMSLFFCKHMFYKNALVVRVSIAHKFLALKN